MKSHRLCLALFFVSLVSSVTASAVEFTNLLSFDGINGAEPWCRLFQATDGLLYGTTYSGGGYAYGPGTIFRMTLSGNLTTLHQFDFASGGYYPAAGVMQASDGNFYGTTTYGQKVSSSVPNFPAGLIYRMTPLGEFTNLYEFSGVDGANPWAGPLVQGRDGFLYDTTSTGGSGELWGSIYRISTNGFFNSLCGFYGDDGYIPYGGLVEGSDGNFYGTMSEGGNRFGIGLGTVFKVTPSGAFTKLFSLNGQTGAHPFGGLVQASDGNFYGVTQQGGPSYGDQKSVNGQGFGTIFRITTNGSLTTLTAFYQTNGAYPYGPLMQGSDGFLYGTTLSGGANTNLLFNDPADKGYGTLFRITTNGEFSTLFSFDGTNGAAPFGTPMQANDGSFYGTTEFGGAFNLGTVYRFKVPLPPTIGAMKVLTNECGLPNGIFSDVITNYSGSPLTAIWSANQVAMETNIVQPALQTITFFQEAPALPPGTNVIELTVTDGTNTVSASTTVVVVDTIPPVIDSAAAIPSVLWPARSQMVNVRVIATVEDSCRNATFKIVNVQTAGVSSGKKGRFIYWQITGDDTVSLRAERGLGGRDRVYLITLQATDLSGNVSEPRVVTVVVPKNQPGAK